MVSMPLIQLHINLQHAVSVEGDEVVRHQALLALHHGVGELFEFLFFHSVFVQRFFREDLVKQVFERFPGIVFTAAEQGGYEAHHLRYFPVLFYLDVVLHHAGEDGVIALAVRNVVLSAERVGERVDGGAAGGAEGDARVVGGGEEGV